jgi:hypothetical protein
MRLALSICFLVQSFLLCAADQKRITLHELELTFNAETGGVVRMAYPATGTILACEPDQGDLLTLAYPTSDFVAMNLAARHSRARFSRDGNSLTIHWDQLAVNRPALPLPPGKVMARVTIRPAPDGCSIILTAHVENESKTKVTQILFPDFNGLRAFGDDPELIELRMGMGVVNPFAGPVRLEGRSSFYPPKLWQQYPFEPVYQMNALRWLDYGNHTGGFSVFQRKWLADPSPNILTHRYETDPQALRMVWQQRTAIEPGQQWDSGEFWLTPHRGGWAKGIETYRAYVKAMNPPRKIPRLVTEGLGFQTIWMQQSSEPEGKHAAFKFSDLVEVARDARAHGLDQVVLWGWCKYGSLPLKPCPGLGSMDDLVAAARKANKLGVKIVPFVNVKNLDDSFAARYGVKPGNAASWTYHPELIPGMFNLDTPSGQIDIETNNKIWQQDVFDEFKRWSDAGLTNFCWDVFQDYGDISLIRFMQRVRGLLREKDPESVFGGEPYMSSLERVTQAVDYTWNWLDFTDAAAITNVFSVPRINCNIENSPRIVKMAFAQNLYLNIMPKKPEIANGTAMIRDNPELSEALKTVASLRRKFLRYFTEGIFIGDSILDKPACRFVRNNKKGEVGGALFDPPPMEYPDIFVSGYQLPDRLLMIVLNNTAGPLSSELSSNFAAWLPGQSNCRVAIYNEAGIKINENLWSGGAQWWGNTPELPPVGMCIIEFIAGGGPG